MARKRGKGMKIAILIIFSIFYIAFSLLWAALHGAAKLTTDEVIYMEENETAYTCRNCKHCLIVKTATGGERHKCTVNNEILHTLHPCEVWEEKKQ